MPQLKDLLAPRTDDSLPRDLKLLPDQVLQVCCLDLGAATPEAASQALQEAQAQGFLGSFAVVTKADQTGSYATLVATPEQLQAFNAAYRLGEATRWKGGQASNFPAWAKTPEGLPLHRWLGAD